VPTEVVEIDLPNGATVLAEVEQVEVEAESAEKTGATPKLSFSDVGETLQGVAQVIHNALDTVKPERTTVELGFTLSATPGKLTGFLVEGEGKASLMVRLEWENQS
jgi:hypothetical protein